MIEEIELQLRNFIKVNHREPTLILINPITYACIEEEAIRHTFFYHESTGGIKKYRGIAVKKSLDVDIDKVEVY